VPSCTCLRAFVLCILVSSVAALQAQTKPLNISAIFNDPSLTADAPRGMAWSPDGLRMTYLNGDGDLMAAD
jgi:dipeptidyl-peptidase 4